MKSYRWSCKILSRMEHLLKLRNWLFRDVNRTKSSEYFPFTSALWKVLTTQANKGLKQVVGDLLVLQGPGRGEIWEGAADDRLQSRRTHRNQVKTPLGKGHCHFLCVHVCGLVPVHAWQFGWQIRVGLKPAGLHACCTNLGKQGAILCIISGDICHSWLNSRVQAVSSPAVCSRLTLTFGNYNKDIVHMGCILILLFFFLFLIFFCSTLRASFEQLKTGKSTRELNRLCCYFCPIQFD